MLGEIRLGHKFGRYRTGCTITPCLLWGHSSVQCGVEFSSQADVMRRFGAVLVFEDIEGGRCSEGDIGDPIAGEIADEEASFTAVRGRRGHECGDASAPVVIDRTAIRVEDLVETITGPIEQVMMAGVVGIDSTE